jgi:hypothetical protein
MLFNGIVLFPVERDLWYKVVDSLLNLIYLPFDYQARVMACIQD